MRLLLLSSPCPNFQAEAHFLNLGSELDGGVCIGRLPPKARHQGPRAEMTIFPIKEEAWTLDKVSSIEKKLGLQGQPSLSERRPGLWDNLLKQRGGQDFRQGQMITQCMKFDCIP